MRYRGMSMYGAVSLSLASWDTTSALCVNPHTTRRNLPERLHGTPANNIFEKKACDSPFIRYNRRMAITRRQKEVIDFLSSFTQKNGYSPSYEEIAHGLGLTSLATVHKHVTNLQNKGLLQRAHNRSRSIDVLPPRSSKKGFDRLPLLGRIAAG